MGFNPTRKAFGLKPFIGPLSILPLVKTNGNKHKLFALQTLTIRVFPEVSGQAVVKIRTWYVYYIFV
jgi:hypothetical protein